MKTKHNKPTKSNQRSSSIVKKPSGNINKVLLNIHKYKLYPAPEGVFNNKPKLNKNLNFNNLEETTTKDKISLIGDGSFSKVFLYQDKKTKIKYAVKKMLLQLVLNKTNNKNIILSEIDIQSKIIHPNIIRLYNYFLDKEEINYYLVLEYASHGTLFEKIRFKKGFDESSAFYYFIQAVNAIIFLHKNHIIHRDIKPENLLINENNILKLCDFGWSVYLKNTKRGTFCGTVEYMAPEIIKSKGYGYSIDIWSLGILLYELIHSFSPFVQKDLNFNTVENNIISKKLSFKKEMSNECQDLISKLLEKDVSKRIKLKDIYQHPFVLKYVNMIYHHLRIPPIRKLNSNNDIHTNENILSPKKTNNFNNGIPNKIFNTDRLNKSKILEISNESQLSSSSSSSSIEIEKIPNEPHIKEMPIKTKIIIGKNKNNSNNRKKRNEKFLNINNLNNLRANKTMSNKDVVIEKNNKKSSSLSNLQVNDINKDGQKRAKYHKINTNIRQKPIMNMNQYNLEKLLTYGGPDEKLTINIRKSNKKNKLKKIFINNLKKKYSIKNKQSLTSHNAKLRNNKNDMRKHLNYNHTVTNLIQKPILNKNNNNNNNNYSVKHNYSINPNFSVNRNNSNRNHIHTHNRNHNNHTHNHNLNYNHNLNHINTKNVNNANNANNTNYANNANNTNYVNNTNNTNYANNTNKSNYANNTNNVNMKNKLSICNSLPFMNPNNINNKVINNYMLYSNANVKKMKKKDSKNKLTKLNAQRNNLMKNNININNNLSNLNGVNKNSHLSYTDISNRNSRFNNPKKITLNLSNVNVINFYNNSNPNDTNSNSINKLIQKINTYFDRAQAKNIINGRGKSQSVYKKNNTEIPINKKNFELKKINNNRSMVNSESRKKYVRKCLKSNHNHNLFFHYSCLMKDSDDFNVMKSTRNLKLVDSPLPPLKLCLRKSYV